MNKDQLLTKLWEQYADITPSAKKIHELLEDRGEEIQNDHIAIRTFNDKRVNIAVLEKPFLNVGYEARGEYNFETKKLYAKHYEHVTDKNAPRIFISELELEKCSAELQETVQEILNSCDQNVFNDPELVLSGSVAPKVFTPRIFTLTEAPATPPLF
jgi:hypothetical protein